MDIAAAATAGRDNWHRRYVLGLLVVVYAINIMDRQVLALLLEDIKRDFALSDGQLGLLGGIAFAFFYSFLGIPLARRADAGDARGVLAACALLWSVATALCGLAAGFYTLLLARVFTAIGEAGGSPASHALIAGQFPLASRATALSIYALGVPLGAIVGNLASGWLNEYFHWRIVFLAVGVPGVLMALLVRCTLRSASPRAAAIGGTPSLRTVFTGFCRCPSYVHMCMAAALHSVVWYAGSTWNASFLMRSHFLGPAQAGTIIASFSLVGLIGTFFGGYMADRVATSRGDARWYMWVPAIAIVGMLPLQFCAYLGTDLQFVVGAFWLMMMLASTFFGPAYAVSQALATDGTRAMAASILLFVQTLVGLGVGPWLTGIASDMLAPVSGSDSLRHALVIVGLVNLWSVFHYLRAARHYRRDLGAREGSDAGMSADVAAA